VILIISAVVTAQSPARVDTRFDAARTVIRRVMQENEIPSFTVAVAEGGEIVWEEGFGLLDGPGKDDPRHPRHTLFPGMHLNAILPPLG
jgi:CubicO group peptidase (beta-lactamase class C family)